MRISRPVAIATLAATTIAGGVGGATLLGPAGAEQSSPPVAAVDVAPAAGAGRCGQGLEAVAEAVGVSTDELREALGGGRTIAEVAEANGTDPQDVIDALVAGGTERLDAAVADGRIDQATADERIETLPERAADLVNGDLDRDLRRHPARPVALRTIAETIGISTDDLRGALRDGQTIAQVAETNGTDPQDVIDALTTRATQRITKAVNGDTVRQRC
jgi:DNA-directed RNA polymerase specialized sigma subunit